MGVRRGYIRNGATGIADRIARVGGTWGAAEALLVALHVEKCAALDILVLRAMKRATRKRTGMHLCFPLLYASKRADEVVAFDFYQDAGDYFGGMASG